MNEKKENAFLKLWHNTNGKIGLLLLLSITLLALLAPVLTEYDPLAMGVGPRLEATSAQHWMGTDEYGRDTFSRILYGARSSLGIGINSVAIAALLGINIGMIAGYLGGAFDNVSMRLMDAVIVNVPSFARLTRSSILRECNCGYVASAKALGYSRGRILYQEILPNIQSTLFVQVTVSIASAILLESALSFLGLGNPPPAPSWGAMLSTGKEFLLKSPWCVIFPGLILTILITGLYLLGDGMRAICDPRQTEVS